MLTSGTFAVFECMPGEEVANAVVRADDTVARVDNIAKSEAFVAEVELFKSIYPGWTGGMLSMPQLKDKASFVVRWQGTDDETVRQAACIPCHA